MKGAVEGSVVVLVDAGDLAGGPVGKYGSVLDKGTVGERVAADEDGGSRAEAD